MNLARPARFFYFKGVALRSNLKMILGSTIGRLTIMEMVGTGPRGKSWLCKCSCGESVRLSTSQLMTGGYRSCGRHQNKSDKVQPVPKELIARYSLTVVSWRGMLSRCHYVKEKQDCYKGIDICSDWYSFENFLRDMGPRPGIEYSIDRIESTDHYYKENCQWLLKKDNSRKIRQNLTPERNKRVSEGLKRAYAEGRIVITEEMKAKIALGGKTRLGRKLQNCGTCGKPSYLPVCQKCRKKSKGVSV